MLAAPNPPAIDELSADPIFPGAKLNLVCRATNASNKTQLLWYSNDEQLDATYTYADGIVVNELEYTAPSTGPLSTLECRLIHPPAELELSALIDVPIQGYYYLLVIYLDNQVKVKQKIFSGSTTVTQSS